MEQKTYVKKYYLKIDQPAQATSNLIRINITEACEFILAIAEYVLSDKLKLSKLRQWYQCKRHFSSPL
jgi:hypothetical protein